MSVSLSIGQRTLSPDAPVLVIAEIGVNHDGSVERALELVQVASDAGADAVKLQVFRAAALVNGRGVLAQYQKQTTPDAESSAELLRRYELSEGELGRVIARARALGLLAVATPFSPGDVGVCARLGLDAIKVASPDVVNVPLLEACAGTGLPMLVSTGAATMAEIEDARRLLAVLGAPHLLMHCVSAYPTSDDQAHLCFIPQLVRRFGPLVGYSDHAQSILSGALAVAAGALVVERHLTYDTAAHGPDHAASSDPEMFANYVDLVREATVLRGTGAKRVLPLEQDVRTVSRQSLVLTVDLPGDARIEAGHLTVQRPGTGISAREFSRAVGERTTRALAAGTLLTWDMLAA